MSANGIILLVEDNPRILDINRRILENEGIMVLTARNIDEARKHISSTRPDITVLDIMLPDGSGIDFLSELQAAYDTPSNPVCALFLTAKTEHADILTGLSAGGYDYMTKPYDINEFRMRVLGFLRLVKSARSHNINIETSSKTSPVLTALTEKEIAVAFLAAQGLFNKEIAARVFLSVSRVKTCLSSIYRKLGISKKNNKRDILAQILK